MHGYIGNVETIIKRKKCIGAFKMQWKTCWKQKLGQIKTHNLKEPKSPPGCCSSLLLRSFLGCDGFLFHSLAVVSFSGALAGVPGFGVIVPLMVCLCGPTHGL